MSIFHAAGIGELKFGEGFRRARHLQEENRRLRAQLTVAYLQLARYERAEVDRWDAEHPMGPTAWATINTAPTSGRWRSANNQSPLPQPHRGRER